MYFVTGYSGVKCEIHTPTTPATTQTTPTALKCTECVAPGTQYCAFENNLFVCKCNQGNKVREGQIHIDDNLAYT